MTPEQLNQTIFSEFKTFYDPTYCTVYSDKSLVKIDKTKRTCVVGFKPDGTERASLGINAWALKRDYSMPIRLYMPKEEPAVNTTILLGAFQTFFQKRTFNGVYTKSTRVFQSAIDPQSQMTITDMVFSFSLQTPIGNLSETPDLKTLTQNVVSPAFDRFLRTEADEKLQTESDEDLLREEDA